MIAESTPATGQFKHATIWYQVRSWAIEIEPVRVIKFTDKTVTVIETWNGHSTAARHLRGYEYFPTFELAKQSLIDRCERAQISTAAKLAACEQDLKTAKALRSTGVEFQKPQGTGAYGAPRIMSR